MRFEGQTTINAPRQKVWDFLTDPSLVSACAPGVESVEVVEPGRKFTAIAAIGLGAARARFKGEAEFVELDPPTRATIVAHGNAPGSAADVNSVMILSDGPDGSTVVDWTADIVIRGVLASLAARMMGPVTQRLTEQFFDCAKQKIEA